MSIETYNHYANLWAITKPIRGRSVDVRPIGQRRRDWEQIVRKPLLSGEYSYAAKLYQTDCVEYFPNGDIVLRTGGWATPSTGEFIYEHSPFMCFKRNRKLWVKQTNIDTVYPLNGEMRFKWTDAGYVIEGDVMVRKRVVNRVKAKAAREPLLPFLDWVRAFLTLSDGWVMHETMKQVLGWSGNETNCSYAVKQSPDTVLFEMLNEPQISIDIDPEGRYLEVLCRMAHSRFVHPYEVRAAEVVMWEGSTRKFPIEFCDLRIAHESIKDKLYRMVASSPDVIDIKEVKPTKRTMSNVV